MTVKVILSSIGIVILLMVISCEDRERANPFDPENPKTGGAPDGVRLVSNRHEVTLSWNPMKVNDLAGYIVYRSVSAGEPEFYRETGDQTLLLESYLDYDVLYNYTVAAFTVYDTGNTAQAQSITPGPFNIWIADYYGMSVKRMTYDGSRTISSNVYDSPVDIGFDRVRDQIFVADYWNRQVEIIDQNMSSAGSIALSGFPVAIELDLSGQLIVVMVGDSNTVAVYGPERELEIQFPYPGNLSVNTSVDYDPSSHLLWCTDSSSVKRINMNNPGVIEGIGEFRRIGQLSVDRLNGACWVAADSAIFYLTSNGSLDTAKTGFQTYGISTDPYTGDCYYTGYSFSSGEWETGFISAGNDLSDSRILGNEYSNLYGIQAVPSSGDCGIIVNQVLTWKLLRFTNSGELIGEYEDTGSRLVYALE